MPGGGKGGKGGGSTTVHVVNSGTTNVDADSTVEIRGLDDMRQTVKLELPQPLALDTKHRNELVLPQPFRTESRQELAVTEPVVTDSRNAMSLDIRPVAVDLCLNVNMGPPAPTCIRQPYHHHFGVTLFGVELVGLNFSGESQTIVQDMPKQPQVSLGGPEPHHHHRSGSSPGSRRSSGTADAGGSEPRAGLRIRLGP